MHTGSPTGNDRVYDAAFKRAGVVRVKEVADLFGVAEDLDSRCLFKTIVRNVPEDSKGILSDEQCLDPLAGYVIATTKQSVAVDTEQVSGNPAFRLQSRRDPDFGTFIFI